MRSQFTLNRFGTFRTKLSVPSYETYKYSVRTVCGTYIDNEGFIVDSARVDQQIQFATTKAYSCERLCLLIANRLRKIFKLHGAELQEIYVRISPVNNLSIYMEYKEKYGQ